MIKDKFKENYTEIQSIQGQTGVYNFDRYMLGLYNGMEMIISMYENREPNYKDANEIKFLNDKQDNLQQRIDLAKKLLKRYIGVLDDVADSYFENVLSILQD